MFFLFFWEEEKDCLKLCNFLVNFWFKVFVVGILLFFFMFICLLFLNDWFIFLWGVFNLNCFVRVLFFCIFLMIFFCIRVVELIFLIYEFLFLGDVLFWLFFLYFILVVLFLFSDFLRYFVDFFSNFRFNDFWCVVEGLFVFIWNYYKRLESVVVLC